MLMVVVRLSKNTTGRKILHFLHLIRQLKSYQVLGRRLETDGNCWSKTPLQQIFTINLCLHESRKEWQLDQFSFCPYSIGIIYNPDIPGRSLAGEGKS